ncbi:MAG: ABC transporter permease [Rubrivivax sp.]
MRALLELAWRDLRASMRGLWVFAACLTLGVSLVAAGGALFRQVDDSLRADMRALFGGDVEVRSRQALDAATLEWMRARGQVSPLTTLRTMMTGADAPSAGTPAIDAPPAPASGSDATIPVQRSHLVELQAIDARYPLVGELRLEPPGPAARRLEEVAGRWGIAVDPVLAQRMGLAVGSLVEVGDATLEVRALIAQQPDRSLRADWNGAPVLVTAGALQATGLLQPFSRVDHRYRVRVDGSAQAWRDAYLAAHPGGDAELRTVDDRSERIADVLGQVGAGLLLVGLSALLIGGLGVHHSVQSWLQQRLGTLATLRAVGLRDGRLAALVLAQVAMLAAASSIAGAAIGAVLALAGLRIVSGVLPMAPSAGAWFAPLALAVVFGKATALLLAQPAVSRARPVSPAARIRRQPALRLQTPPRPRWAVGLGGSALLALLALALPDPRFAAAFVLVVVALLGLLEGLMRLKVGGHSTASNTPKRPLVPAPT